MVFRPIRERCSMAGAGLWSGWRSRLLAIALTMAFLASLQADLLHDAGQLGVNRGVIAVIGLPSEDPAELVELAEQTEAILYVQDDDEEALGDLREALRSHGLLGQRVFVDAGTFDKLQLADNVADGALIAASANVDQQEVLRILRPRGLAVHGDRKLEKPVPEGIDEWTHPYHSPDNNPQSNDQLVRGDMRTQFLAVPKFSPMPEQTVVAGGRIFKAMGHIAHKANQNEWLNTLLCINAYNGTILWRRPLPEGFMIHRNTMIATDDALIMGDAKSCKVFDAATGEIRDEITVPESITDGPVWKWMALKDGVLYALVGNPEIQVDTQKSARRGLGHWPWGMWKGHDYKDPRTSFGFGRTLVAIDLESKQLLWHYRDEEFLDARGICMSHGKIYCFSPERFLLCIGTEQGDRLWRNTDEALLSAVGPNSRAQHYVTGYATTCYMKCNEDYIFFAGPQREKMVTASTKDGSLVWSYPHGNLQLVLRDDGIYAAGPTTTGVRLDYATGEQLGSLPTRRACTRATGCADSIFYRTSGGTVRVMTETQTAEHISPMRPPCQDGVIVSNGHLYWGPWMCGCQLSLYGHIALAPVGEVGAVDYSDARWSREADLQPRPLTIDGRDWTSYRGGNDRRDQTATELPAKLSVAWKQQVVQGTLPTAPVVAGGLVFVADRTGTVQALRENGEQVWIAYTGGAIYYAPAIAHDRLYVGSADGRVYAFEAATGRLLWKFRVSPGEERIPVYGDLINRWPVAGGVVVHDDALYAVAGIAHYDGTYVVKLDAKTGELLAHNSSSGTLSDEVNSGISLQGNLMIVDNELRFLAGGVYETARYDLDSLQCLNQPKVQLTSQYRTAFYPFYPAYGKYVSVEHERGDGSMLVLDASYEGSQFTDLALQGPLPPGVPKDKKEAARWGRRHGNAKRKVLWQDDQQWRFTACILSGDTLLGAGHRELQEDGEEPQPALLSIDIRDGRRRWEMPLDALVVKGGAAASSEGNVYVTLENGELVCFTAE